MNFLLKLSPATLAVTSSAADAAGLSEAELLQRYPALAIVASLLFVLGLACDIYLFYRLVRAYRSSTTGEPVLFKVQPAPWGLRELGMATLSILALLSVTAATLSLAAHRLHLNDEDEISLQMIGQILAYLIILAGFLIYFRYRNLSVTETFGLRPTSSLRAFVSGLFFYLAILPPLGVVFAVYAKICQAVGIDQTPQPVADLLVSSDSALARGVLILFAIVVAPVAEEFFFRGFAYPALKQRLSMWKAIMIVSAVFAVIHVGPDGRPHIPSLGSLFALAIGFVLANELTGSLLTSITMHALFNATNVAMLMYVRAHL